MPLNGSGVYAAPAGSWNPAVDGTTINSTDWIALLADLTTALSTAVYKDGQQTITANIPMSSFKLTGLAAGTTAGDSVRYEQIPTVKGVFPFSSGVTNSGAGSTVYMGVGSFSATEANVIISCPLAGTLKNMYVRSSAAPGGGETYTVTLRKASVDQTLTCTISGAGSSSSNDTTHTVAVSAGDALAVKVVYSGGAATALLTVAFEFDPS